MMSSRDVIDVSQRQLKSGSFKNVHMNFLVDDGHHVVTETDGYKQSKERRGESGGEQSDANGHHRRRDGSEVNMYSRSSINTFPVDTLLACCASMHSCFVLQVREFNRKCEEEVREEASETSGG